MSSNVSDATQSTFTPGLAEYYTLIPFTLGLTLAVTNLVVVVPMVLLVALAVILVVGGIAGILLAIPLIILVPVLLLVFFILQIPSEVRFFKGLIVILMGYSFYIVFYVKCPNVKTT